MTLRRWLPWLLVVVVVAVLALVLGDDRSAAPMDPTNNDRDGARALATVLADRGTDVDVLRGARHLQKDDDLGPGTTVLLADTTYLTGRSGGELLDAVADVDRLVVLIPAPDRTPGPVLDLDVTPRPGGGAAVEAGCDTALVRDGDRLTGWSTQLAVGEEDRDRVTACFPPTAGHHLGGAVEGALALVDAGADRPEIVLAGLGTSWTNGEITREANAALALRLLEGDRLVWVIPGPGDVDPDEGAPDLWGVLPRNLTPSLWLLGAAVLALAVVQGRRLGPVVTEPLPSVVRATETTMNRARLYQQARDRSHTMTALQEGARYRLARRLGLSGSEPPARIVTAVAGATGRSESDLTTLLTDPEVADDTGLVERARRLRDLEGALRDDETDQTDEKEDT